jgi:hypothetical protein
MKRGASGVVAIVNRHEIRSSGQVAMAAACIFGLSCAGIGGVASVVAVVWIGVTLVFVRRTVGPKIGITTLGVAVIYGLAALAGFSGTDPEDVDKALNLRLAAVALGCAAVGITSALVWMADRSRHRR